MTTTADSWGSWSFASPDFNEFANPWHDEIGRFAPKGTGTKSTGAASEKAFEVLNGRAIKVAAEDLDDVLLEFADVDHPVDLTLVTVEDHAEMFSKMRDKGMPRDQMPQIPREHIAEFQDHLASMGVQVTRGDTDPRTLAATQSELDGRKVGQMLRRIRNNDFDWEKPPLWISNDGHVLDGHHRWAATAAEVADRGSGEMATIHVDLPMSQLLKIANEFVDAKGIKRVGIGDPGTVPYRDRVAAAVQNEPVDEHFDIATDADDGITDEDLADLAHGDGTAFAEPDDANSEMARRRKRRHWSIIDGDEFANPWHDEIGRFAPKGTGTKFDGKAAGKAYNAALQAREAAAEALEADHVLFYTEHGTRERAISIRQVVEQYFQYGSSPVNQELRRNGIDKVASSEHRQALQDAVVLDEAIERGGFEFPEDTVLLRGIRHTADDDLQPGFTFTDNGFISGTASQRHADLASNPGGASVHSRTPGTIVELHVPKGTRGLANTNDAEQEIMLPRGGQFQVVDVVDRDGRRVAIVEARFPATPPKPASEIPTINDMLDRVESQRSERDRLERERGLAAAGSPDESAIDRILWDMSDLRSTFTVSYEWGPKADPAAEFANPWHDEQGRFAPKGTGRKFDGPAVGEAEPVMEQTNSLGRNIPLPTVAALQGSYDPVPETPEVECTLLEHMDENGNLTPERQAVHDKLIADALEGIQPGEPRRALVLGGGAAAGKSSALEHGFVDAPEGAVTINPDEFKIKLPETAGPASDGRQGNGAADRIGEAWAAYAHEESSHLGKRLQSAATEMGANVVLDKTSSNGDKAVREIKAMKDQGYAVDVCFVTTDINEAVDRAIQRGKEQGRAVPRTELLKGHEGANKAFLQVASEAGVPTTLVTTISRRPDGTIPPPILTASTDGSGTMVVHNRDAWDTYLSRVPTGVPDSLRVVFDEDLVRQAASVRHWQVLGDEGDVAAEPYTEGVTADYVEGLPDSYDDRRTAMLVRAATTDKQPDDLTDGEREYIESIRKDIAEIQAAGMSYDIPIQSTL